jgi:D-serine dehydratase
MAPQTIMGKTIQEWKEHNPALSRLISKEDIFWKNPNYTPFSRVKLPLGEGDMLDAEKRWLRFAPYLAKVFPQTSQGIIESPLRPVPHMKKAMEKIYNNEINGDVFVKLDSHLPIAGSIKARGGIYEVLKHAEQLAIDQGLLTINDNYVILADPEFHKFFSQYSIAVGSTGNLGLSIGIMSAKLGFRVSVHMSADAKQWKKDLLRAKGVHVMEYESDYSKAVEEGRKLAATDPHCYFVDDENSTALFLGYSVAALRLKNQLDELGITITEDKPLCVYLPCGVGGAPGGVTFGLKQIYGDHVHCYFAEPTHAPCMALGLITGLHDEVCVQDFGIDNITDADGLAVGRPSKFVGKTIENLISGLYTIQDEELYSLLRLLKDTEGIELEPSALAGFIGPLHNRENATHIVWATGGSLVPREIMDQYYKKGQ